jgi:hypothetical protein
MLSTAWSRTDPFWQAWSGDEQSWMRLKATADEINTFTPEFLEQERRQLGEDAFMREYLGIPVGAHTSPFTWELYEAATRSVAPLVAPGPAFRHSPEPQGIPLPNPFRNLEPGEAFTPQASSLTTSHAVLIVQRQSWEGRATLSRPTSELRNSTNFPKGFTAARWPMKLSRSTLGRPTTVLSSSI